MAMEKQETHAPQIGLALISNKRSNHFKKTDDLDSPAYNSFRSPSYTDAIIIDNEDDEPKKKKHRLGSWWGDVKVLNELSSVVKGSPDSTAKGNDVVSRVDSWFSSTHLHEEKTKKRNDDERSLSSSSKDNRHVSLEQLGVTVEDIKSMPWEAFDPTWEIRSETMDPWLGGYIKDMLSPHH